MLRKMVLSLVLMDNFLTNLARKPLRTRWILSGKCKKCGRCCREIHLKIDPRLLNNRFTFSLITMWISWLFCFYLKRVDRRRNYLVFGCKKLKWNGQCGAYYWRPNVCRNYPLVDYFEKPALIRGCGYKPSLR